MTATTTDLTARLAALEKRAEVAEKEITWLKGVLLMYFEGKRDDLRKIKALGAKRR